MDNNILIQKKDYSIWIDEQKIVHFQMDNAVAKVNEELSKSIYNDAVAVLDSLPDDKYEILIDVKKSQPENLQVRKMLAKTMQISKFGKVAVIGFGTVERTLVFVVAKAAGNNNIRPFASEEEAIKWLRER